MGTWKMLLVPLSLKKMLHNIDFWRKILNSVKCHQNCDETGLTAAISHNFRLKAGAAGMNQPSRGLDGSEMHPLQIWTDQVTKTMKQLIQEGSPEQARTTPEQRPNNCGLPKKILKKPSKRAKARTSPNNARTPKRSMNHASCYGKPKWKRCPTRNAKLRNAGMTSEQIR